MQVIQNQQIRNLKKKIHHEQNDKSVNFELFQEKKGEKKPRTPTHEHDSNINECCTDDAIRSSGYAISNRMNE